MRAQTERETDRAHFMQALIILIISLALTTFVYLVYFSLYLINNYAAPRAETAADLRLLLTTSLTHSGQRVCEMRVKFYVQAKSVAYFCAAAVNNMLLMRC